MKKERGAKIFVLSAILILSLSLVSAGWFSDLFKTNKVVTGKVAGGGIGGPIPSGITITFTDPQSSGGVYILHYNSWGTKYTYAENYCKLVMGCTGYSAATTVADSAYACRCDAATGMKCPGVSCTTKSPSSAGNCSCAAATGTQWSRFSSITCTGCSTSSSCFGTNNITCPNNGLVGRAIGGAIINFMCTSVSPYKDYCKMVSGKCVRKSCSEIPMSVCNATHGGCTRTTTITAPNGNQNRIGGDPKAPGGWDPSKPWPKGAGNKDCTLSNCNFIR